MMDNSFRVAVKMSKDQKIMDKASFDREANIMKKLNHENVITLHGICTGDPLWIITEFMYYGSLEDFLIKHKDQPFEIITKSDFALQVSNY